MTIKYSDFILEQSISDASTYDIEMERIISEMDVCISLLDAYQKRYIMEMTYGDILTSAAGSTAQGLGNAIASSYTSDSSILLKLVTKLLGGALKAAYGCINHTSEIINPEEAKKYNDELTAIKQRAASGDISKTKATIQKAKITIGHSKRAVADTGTAIVALVAVVTPFIRQSQQSQSIVDRIKQAELSLTHSPADKNGYDQFNPNDYSDDLSTNVDYIMKDINEINSEMSKQYVVDLRNTMNEFRSVDMYQRINQAMMNENPETIHNLSNVVKNISNRLKTNIPMVNSNLKVFKKCMITLAPRTKYVGGRKVV